METEQLKRYLKSETLGGLVLIIAACIAVVLTNSPLNHLYQNFFNTPLKLGQSFLFWINQGLMTLFFLLVGLELKKEFFIGELSRRSQILLPAFAALGGMLVPAILFIILTYDHPNLFSGWTIPVATDIAFALAVLTLFKKIPTSLKIFLMALAVFDDIGAIIIIALNHVHHFYAKPMICAVILWIAMWYCNQLGKKNLLYYFILGLLLWVTIIQSGIHGTIAGVLLALTIPIEKVSKLHKKLMPWVIFLILPIFALANAGFSFAGFSANTFTNHLFIGIFIGLFIGKQLGVMSFTWVLVQLKLAKLPTGVSWLQLYGVAALCGIGFTMSLFLGTLAFPENDYYQTIMRVGIFVGSILSALFGSLVLSTTFIKRKIKRG